MIASFVRSSFDASHKGPFADQIHGHTWFVEIGWQGDLINAWSMRAQLENCLAEWDHKMLDGRVEPTNEGVAQAIADKIAGLSEVTVWREGRLQCGARWINTNNERGLPNARAHRQEIDRRTVEGVQE